MMRRLTEPELTREPARPLTRSFAEGTRDSTDLSPASVQRAALLSHVQRALASELSGEQLAALRPRLEHAIARGFWGDPCET